MPQVAALLQLGRLQAAADCAIAARSAALVRTVDAPVLLLCRPELNGDLVFLIERTLFDHVYYLPGSQSISLGWTLDENELPRGLALHPGARRFVEQEKRTLLIATGSINGRYWRVGKVLQSLWERRGIPSRVVATDGSVESRYRSRLGT